MRNLLWALVLVLFVGEIWAEEKVQEKKEKTQKSESEKNEKDGQKLALKSEKKKVEKTLEDMKIKSSEFAEKKSEKSSQKTEVQEQKKTKVKKKVFSAEDWDRFKKEQKKVKNGEPLGESSGTWKFETIENGDTGFSRKFGQNAEKAAKK